MLKRFALDFSIRMTDYPRANFEFSVDEAVDVHLGALKASPVASSWRRRELLRFVLLFAIGALLGGAFLIPRRELSLSLALAGIGVAVVLGLLFAIPFGWYYDRVVRKRTRRLLVESLGGEGPHRCSIEIRPEGLWVSQCGVESSFDWREATGAEDTPDGVLVTFKVGRVLARSRGFVSPERRQEFLLGVKEGLKYGAANSKNPELE